jgi:hypothetical protein
MIRVDGDYSETASDVLVIHTILAQSLIFFVLQFVYLVLHMFKGFRF